MPYDIRALVMDPEFDKLLPTEKRELLVQAGAKPEFIAELVPESSFFDRLKAATRQALTTLPIGPAGAANLGMNLAREGRFEGRGPGTAGEPTGEDIIDMLPAIGAVGLGTAALPTAVGTGPVGPGMAAGIGAVGGEAWRQNIRRFLGMPAATGVVQRFAEMDPDSEEAAVAGLGVEALLTPVGAGATKVLKPLAKAVDTSALRSLINLLQPMKQRDQSAALKLAERMRAEGIAPMGSTRAAQVETANTILDQSTNSLESMLQPLYAADARVRTHVPTSNRPRAVSIDRRIERGIPALLPTGEVPEVGAARREMAEKVLRDARKVIDPPYGPPRPGGHSIPLKTTLSEVDRLDDEFLGYYESGRENVPAGVKKIKNAADAFRIAAADEFPEVGAERLRKHEMLDITRLLEAALEKSNRIGMLGTAAAEGQAMGSLATGRHSIWSMALAQAGIGTGPWASTTSAVKTALAGILKGGEASAQAWVRMANHFDLENAPDDEPVRPEDQAVEDLARSIQARQQGPVAVTKPPETPPTPPTLTVTEEEFLRRYQQ